MAEAGQWRKWVRLGQSPPLPRVPGECGVVVVVIQQWEGPGPLEGGETGGRGAGVSTLRKDKISSGAGGAASPKNRMSRRGSAPRSRAAWGAGRPGDLGLPELPLLARARSCPGYRAAPRPEVRLVPWGPTSGWTRARPLALLLPALARALEPKLENAGAWLQHKLSERLPRASVLGAVRITTRVRRVSRAFLKKEKERFREINT